MMYRPIVLVVVWSLIFIEIDSMPPRTESETNLTDAIRIYYDMEMNLLDVVKLYYNKINEQSSSSNSQIKVIPDYGEAVALIQASLFTFWMAVTLRIYNVYNTCIYTNEPEENYDLYFSEMMFAFTEFKKEIKKYYNSNKKKTKSKSVVIDADSSRDMTVQEAANMILNLSLEFISSESILEKQKLDKRRDGIIHWNLLEEHRIKNKSYKTVFPSCLIIRRNFHKLITEDDDSFRWSYIHTNEDPPEGIDLKFDESQAITFYSCESRWKYIMMNMETIYKESHHFHDVQGALFSYLTNTVWELIEVFEINRIQDFLVEETFNRPKKTRFAVKHILRDRAWILPSLKNASIIWKTVLEQNFVNNKISTQERIKNVLAVVCSIRDVDKISDMVKKYLNQ